MKIPCSGLLPSIEICYLRTWRRGESLLFYFKISTVDVGECIQPQQHSSKQHSKVVTPQERLLSIIQIFCQGVSSFESLASEATNFLSFLLSTTYLFHYSFHFNTGHLH